MQEYMLSVHHRADDTLPEGAAAEEIIAAVDTFNGQLRSANAWVFAGGLHPVDVATVVDAAGGDVITTDGPFAETKEYLGGFWVISAPDLDAALDWAARASQACRAPVEVRPFTDEG